MRQAICNGPKINSTDTDVRDQCIRQLPTGEVFNRVLSGGAAGELLTSTLSSTCHDYPIDGSHASRLVEGPSAPRLKGTLDEADAFAAGYADAPGLRPNSASKSALCR